MVSLTLKVSVIAFNVLVLIPLAKCWLNKLPGSVDLGPNVCTSLMVEQPRGTCQGILGELGILGLRGFLGLGKNWGTDMWNADGQDAGPLPRTPLLSLRSRVLPAGTWASRRGRFCLNRGLRGLRRRIAQMGWGGFLELVRVWGRRWRTGGCLLLGISESQPLFGDSAILLIPMDP